MRPCDRAGVARAARRSRSMPQFPVLAGADDRHGCRPRWRSRCGRPSRSARRYTTPAPSPRAPSSRPRRCRRAHRQDAAVLDRVDQPVEDERRRHHCDEALLVAPQLARVTRRSRPPPVTRPPGSTAPRPSARAASHSLSTITRRDCRIPGDAHHPCALPHSAIESRPSPSLSLFVSASATAASRRSRSRSPPPCRR